MANKIYVLLTLLACILLGYLLYSTVEVYEETVDAGWTFEAKRNPYLAAEIYLTKSGDQVESSNSKTAIDRLDQFDSLLISNSGFVANKLTSNKLIDWVSKGGSLVIGANETRGKLLEDLGVEYKSAVYNYADGEESISGDRDWRNSEEITPVEKALEEYGDQKNKKICKQCETDKTLPECDACREENETLKPKPKFSDLLKEANKKNHENLKDDTPAQVKPKIETIPERRFTHVRFEGYEQNVNAVFSPWSIITHSTKAESDSHSTATNSNQKYSPFYSVGSQQGVHLMQFSIGKGMITVVSDASIWDNHQLAREDHAYLLKSLGLQKHSLILYGVSMPSITALAWTKFPETILVLIALLIFWLWFASTRVGPIKVLNARVRRSIMDSIMGLATYQHKRKKYWRLITPVVAEIVMLANRQISGFSSADQNKKETLLSEHSQVPKHIISQVLNPHSVQDDESFQKHIKLLQDIRKTL